jgi:hypothetical protein
MSVADQKQLNNNEQTAVNVDTKPKLILTKLNMVATWEYNLDDPECKLCHKDLMTPVQEPNNNILNADVIVGTCEHAFHSVCMDAWCRKGNMSCPYCLVNWKVSKNIGASIYMYKDVENLATFNYASFSEKNKKVQKVFVTNDDEISLDNHIVD